MSEAGLLDLSRPGELRAFDPFRRKWPGQVAGWLDDGSGETCGLEALSDPSTKPIQLGELQRRVLSGLTKSEPNQN